MNLPTREEGLILDSFLGMSPKYRKRVLRDKILATSKEPIFRLQHQPTVLVPGSEQPQ